MLPLGKRHLRAGDGTVKATGAVVALEWSGDPRGLTARVGSTGERFDEMG